MNNRKPFTIPCATLLIASACHAGAALQAIKDPLKVTVMSKSPIANTPLTIKFLTGRDLKPTDTITLPNGQRVTISDYLASANALEAKLNQLGYSLKSGPPKETVTQVSIDPVVAAAVQTDLDSRIEPGTVQGLKHGVNVAPSAPVTFAVGDYDTSGLTAPLKTSLATSVAAFNAKGVKADSQGGYIVNLSQVKQQFGKDVLTGGLLSINRSAIKPKPKPKAQTIPFTDFYSYKWTAYCGPFSLNFSYDSKYNGTAYITATNSLDTNRTNMTASMSGDFNVSAWTIKKDILKLDASFSGDGTKGETLKADVYFGGNKIFSKDDKLANGGTFGDSAALPWDESIDYTFPVVPGIFITGKAGIDGAVGIKYGGTLYSTSVHAQVTPFAKASAYVQAAVGAGFVVSGVTFGVDAGLKCDVLLVDERVELGCNVGLAWDGRLGIQEELYVKNKIDALKGKVYGFVNIPYIKEYDFSIYNWAGVHQDSTLFDHKFFTPLNVTFSLPSIN